MDPDTKTDSPTRRERELERHRAEILAAAAELFARRGYHGTSVQQIAAQAEFSVGKLYKHFDGKEAIFSELVQSHCRQLADLMERARLTEGPPLERLRRMLAVVIVHFSEHRDFLRIHSREYPTNLEGILADFHAETQGMIAGLLAQAIEQGELPTEDPELLAAVLFGAAGKLLHHLSRGESGKPFDLVPEYIDRLILEPLVRRRPAGD